MDVSAQPIAAAPFREELIAQFRDQSRRQPLNVTVVVDSVWREPEVRFGSRKSYAIRSRTPNGAILEPVHLKEKEHSTELWSTRKWIVMKAVTGLLWVDGKRVV